MLNFEDVEDIVGYMIDEVEEEHPVSVVADRDMILDIMRKMFEYKGISIDICSIEPIEEYDKEYALTLFMDCCDDSLSFSVENIYNSEKDMYFAVDGHVLFHEDVNSKALIDMENNKYVDITHDWFTIGEEECDCDECCGCCECDDNKELNIESDDDGYSITVRCNLDADEAMEMIKDMENRMEHMNDMFREMDSFRKLLRF